MTYLDIAYLYIPIYPQTAPVSAYEPPVGLAALNSKCDICRRIQVKPFQGLPTDDPEAARTEAAPARYHNYEYQ